MRSWLYQIEEYRKVMATRKLGRGKGALRRNQSSPPAPGQTAAAVPAVVSASARLSTTELSRSSGSPGLVLEARVTEITDVTSFWVQIGNTAQLEEYDMMCLKLSAWCSERGGGMAGLPLVGDVIAVCDKASGSWSRAEVTRQITDSIVEVFYVDSGGSGRVNLTNVCNGYPPMLHKLPKQAAQCSLQGVQLDEGDEAASKLATQRFRELVRVPPGSIKAVVNSKTKTTITATLYIQYEGSWTSIAEILKGEGLVEYCPVGPVTISDVSATPTETDVISDDATPTPTHSRVLSFSSVGVTPDGPTPVPSERSVDVNSPPFMGPKTPLNTPPITPTNPQCIEDDGTPDSPPSLVDSDSDSIGRRVADLEEEMEEEEEPSTCNSSLSTPTLSIPLSKLSDEPTSTTKPWPITARQVKGPQLTTSQKSQASSSQTPSTVAPATVPSLADGDDGQASKLSSSSSPEPLVSSESSKDDGTPPLEIEKEENGDQSKINGDGENRLQQEKRLTDTCTEDDDDDVVEIEEDSEVDGSREKSKRGGSAETLSSDDEWDESLLPPRSESSGSSPIKSDEIAEVEEFFRSREMRSNKKLWGQNNAQKHSGNFRKNNRPYYQHDQKRQSPTHDYQDSFRRWGMHNSPGKPPGNGNQGRSGTWCSGVGRGRNRRWGNQTKAVGNGKMTGNDVSNVGEVARGNWKEDSLQEECPRPHPPSMQSYVGDAQQTQFARKSARGRGRGGGGGGGGGTPYPKGPSLPKYPPIQSYSGGIRQSQIVKKGGPSKMDFGRNSSASEGESSALQPSSSPNKDTSVSQAQSENSYGGVGFQSYHGNKQGNGIVSGHDQAPPVQLSSGLTSGVGVYKGLTEEQIKNEVGWYTSAIQRAVKKIVCSLDSSSADQFGSKILELLGDSKAQKLLNFSSPLTPLEVIMLSVVEGMLGLECTESREVINAAIENLVDAAPHQACTFLHSSLVEKATEISRSGGMSKTSQRFCSFLGRLFISASYSNKEEYSTAVGQAVRDCLDLWCRMDADIPDLQKTVYAECFSCLCDEIGPTIDDSGKDNLDAYFNKQVRENILSEKLPREVREMFLDLHTRRLNSWDGRKKVEPPSDDVPPSVETTPTPQTPVTPPSVSDYPVNIVQPVPISTVSMATSGNVYPSSTPVVGEVPLVDCGSVGMMSPTPSSSAFIPAAVQPRLLRRGLSLPSQQMQLAPTPSLSGRSHSLSDVPPEDQYSDPSAQVTEMLLSLSLMDLLPRFEDHMIKDYILDCERENIKSCLLEASIPMGAVVGILDYIDKRRKLKKTSSNQQRSIGGSHSSSSLPLVPHPAAVYSPDPSRSSAPTPAPPPYLAQYQQQQHHPQHLDLQYPSVGSQLGSDGTTPTNYNMAPLYQHQMKPYETPPPPPSSTPQENSLHQHQYSQQPLPVQPPPPPQALSSPTFPQPRLQQLLYQSQSQLSPQAQLQQSTPEVQQQGGAAVTLPQSSLNNMATSPTTAQRRVRLPTASQRGPRTQLPSRQPQFQSPSHSQPYKENKAIRLPRSSTSDGKLSSFSSSSSDQPEESTTHKPLHGFGSIMCVCCGSSDHKTPDCPKRGNFFF